LHAKVRYFRKLAKGWSANLEAEIRKQKKALMEEYDALDILSEAILYLKRFEFLLDYRGD
jgi:hypothetical protein